MDLGVRQIATSGKDVELRGRKGRKSDQLLHRRLARSTCPADVAIQHREEPDTEAAADLDTSPRPIVGPI